MNSASLLALGRALGVVALSLFSAAAWSQAGIIQFSDTDYDVVESDGSIRIDVLRSGGSDGAVTVQYRNGKNEVGAGGFVQFIGALTWQDGESGAKSFSVQIIDDSEAEPTESINMHIENPTGGAQLGAPTQASLHVIDDDGPSGLLSFALASQDIVESAGTAQIEVVRSGGSNGAVTVQYRNGNTQVGPGGFVQTLGMLSWANGEMGSKFFEVRIIDDSTVEPTQTINLHIESPTGGAKLVPPSKSVLRVLDDDADNDAEYGSGIIGAIAQLFANLNAAISSALAGDFGGAGDALQTALTNFVSDIRGLPDDAGTLAELVGLQAGLGPVSAQTSSAQRDVEPVVITGAQIPGWSVPAAEGTALPWPDGAVIGERNAHNGTLIYPAAGVAPQAGVAVDSIAAYRRQGGSWIEIPVQIDERMPYFLANPDSDFGIYSGTDKELSYVWDTEAWDPQGSGPNASYPAATADPVPGLDNDDEVVFMAGDAGERYLGMEYPAGWESVQQVALVDPLDAANLRFVYLVRKVGGSSFNAANGYIQAQRAADADEWVDRYSYCKDDPEKLGSSNTGYGPNRSGTVHRTAEACAQPDGPQGSVADGNARSSTDRFPRDGLVVTTANYRWEASGRWMVRDLRVRRPGDVVDASYDWSARPDLIDRWKGRAFQQSPDSNASLVGFEDEQVNWEANSTLLGWRDGPVRALREVWGADSGTNVTKTEAFYQGAISYRYRVRVHPIPSDGLYTSWDYNRSAMLPDSAERASGVPAGRYFTQLRPQGVPIDGINDDLGNVDSLGGMPAFFDVADASFNLMTGFYNWEQVSAKGDLGSLVYLFELKGATSLGNPLVVPYYRDDACLDDGTGDDPVARPWPGETSSDSRVVGGYTDLDGNGQVDCHERQGAHGSHGVHYFFTHDSDNAFSGQTTTEIDGQQWQFVVPTDEPRNIAEPYANVVRAPLVATVLPLGGNAADTDGDGVVDSDDNCPSTANANQADADADGIGDACDDDDRDGDGVTDDQDAFPDDPSESADADGDGVGDNADLSDDGDAVDDMVDNCPLIANDGQADVDQNGVGDACQTTVACPPMGISIAADWNGYIEPGQDGVVETDVDLIPFAIPAACDVSQVSVEINWDNAAEDLDLYLVGKDAQAGSQSADANLVAGPQEAASLSLPVGAYEAQVVGYTSIGTAYRGRIVVVRNAGAGGGSAECEAAFAGVAGGLSTALVDPALPFGLPARLVLSFPDALARHDAAVQLQSAMLAGAVDVQGLHEFEHLPQIVINTGLVTTSLVQTLQVELADFRMISIWSGEQAIQSLVEDSVPLIGVSAARDAWATPSLPLNGKGVGVAVIDTGLDALHGDFPDERVKENVRVSGDPFGFVQDGSAFVPLPNTEVTSNGHGTHIAGTIMGDGTMSGGRFVGVAPGVDFLSLAVEYGSYLYTLAAMDHILDVRDEYNIRVSNHSYGPVDPDSDPVEPGVQPHRFSAESASSIAIKALYDAGVIAVFAAGNSGPGDDTMGGDAQNPCAIGVASGRKDGTLSNFSSRGVAGSATIVPDITAPGEDIIATRAANAVVSPAAGGNPLPESDAINYIKMSGTSMAAPHVVAAVAILLEANPQLNFGQVLSVLQDNARAMPGYAPHEVGAGYLDVLSALADARVLNQPLVDTDGDGVIDVYDNCPNDSNPGQEDVDLDGIGDTCDTDSGSLCAAPGLPLLFDAAGDYDPSGTGIAAVGGNDNQDLLAAYVAHPYAVDGVQKLEFRLQIADLSQLQPGSAYFLTFKDPVVANAFRGVRMEVAPDLSTAFYTYVPGTNQGGTSDGRFVTSKSATAGSYDPESGEILFVVDPAAVGVDSGDPARRSLDGFLAGISQTDPAATGTLTFMPDAAPDDLSRVGSMSFQPNAFCSVGGDADSDGWDDAVDNCPLDANADQLDSDSDGAGDVCDSDIDGDGVANATDPFPYDPSEWEDTDGDGIGNNADGDDDDDGVADGTDNCPLDYNPLQENTYGGAAGDACEGTIATCPLPNGAYVAHEWEGTIGATVLGQAVTDGEHVETFNGLPPQCSYSDGQVVISWDAVIGAEDLDLEVTTPTGSSSAETGTSGSETLSLAAISAGDFSFRTFGYNSVDTPFNGVFTVTVAGGMTATDTDGDGFADSIDNCPLIANSGQLDTDGDAAGNACDPDDDGDGVPDLSDNCPLIANDQSDSDGNGIGDACEAQVEPRVVVAVIDSGINPYHEFYYAGSRIYPPGSPPSSVTQAVLDDFGIAGDCVIEGLTGTYAVDNAGPNGALYKAQNCEYVHFAGTNVLASSVDPGSVRFFPDDDGDDVHGVGTSAAVLVANPEAIVLFVEGSGAGEFASFTHPAVDIVSTSYGPQGSAPIPFALEEGFNGVYRRGKLHFGACDNSPSTAQQDGTCGAWWAIGVAGYEETLDNEPDAGSGDGGRQIISGTFPDFIADFTQTLPYCQFCSSGEDNYVGGTSFATPRSAGTASRILLQARRLVGHVGGPHVIDESDPVSNPPLLVEGLDSLGNPVAITNWQLRRALEEAAWVPGLDDYDPIVGLFAMGMPINDAAPWLQVGWGVLSPVGGDVVAQTMARLGLGSAPGGNLRAKTSEHCEFQSLIMDSRKAYWDNVAIGSDTWLGPPSPDPYISCAP